MKRAVAVLTLATLLTSCGNAPPVVTSPTATRVQWKVELHTPKANEPDKYDKRDVQLVLDREAQELHAGAATMALGSIQNASYSFAKKPRWGLAILAWPLLFLKTKKHWLALGDSDGVVWVVKLENSNYANVLGTLEREGVEVTRFTEEG